MKYLVFDTCVWLDMLKVEYDPNILTFFYKVSKQRKISMLVPEQVKKEFTQEKVDDVQKEFLEFCNQVIKYRNQLGLANNFELKNLEEFRVNFRLRVNLIKEIFNEYSLEMPTTRNSKDLAMFWAENGKKPFGKSNDLGDSFILASLYTFLDETPRNEVIFVTKNHKDFSEGDSNVEKKRVHPEMAEDFEHRNISYQFDVLKTYHDLRGEFGYTIDDIKEFGASHLASYKITTPSNDIEDSFIKDARTIDVILESSATPTYHQQDTVIRLILSKASYEDYFFRKVKSPKWYQVLNANGLFKISIDPDLQTPKWFGYAVSIFDHDVDPSISKELIGLIHAVVANCESNQHFSYRLIHLFNTVPIKLIDHRVVFETIPKITAGENALGNLLYEIVSGLLKRLLLSELKDYRLLGVQLFEFLVNKDGKLKVPNRTEPSLVISEFGSEFKLDALLKLNSGILLDLIRITANRTQKLLNSTLVRHIQQDFELESGEMIGIEFNVNDNQLETTIHYNNGSRCYKYIRKGDERWQIYSITNSIVGNVKNAINENILGLFGIRFYLEQLLEPDYSFQKRIDQLNEFEVSEGHFALVLRDMLLAFYQRKHTDIHKKFIKELYFSGRYNAFLFRRLVMNTISEQFTGVLKDLLTYLLRKNSAELFEDQRMKDETWSLLHKVGPKLSTNQKNEIKIILQNKSLVWSSYEYEEWQLFWLSALKFTPGFKRWYLRISKQLGKEIHRFPSKSRVRIMPGAIPPLSLAELSKKPPLVMVEYLNSFKSDDSWDGPNESGLFDIMKSIAASNPNLILNNITEFAKVRFIYGVAILRGFQDYFKQNSNLNWYNLFGFCSAFTTTGHFKSLHRDSSSIEYRDTPLAVIEEICSLISLGCRDDKTAFAPELNTQAQQLLSALSEFVNPINKIDRESWGYLTFALNSSSGKLLDVVVILSLRIARLMPKKERIWIPELREIFIKYRETNDINALILEGYYAHQFFFLDYNWMLDQLKANAKLSHGHMVPFINGLFSASSINEPKVTPLIMPYLKWSVNNQIKVRNHGDNLVALHIAHYVIYAHEELDSNHVVFNFIDTADIKDVKELIWTLAENHKYPYSKKIPDKIKFRILLSVEHIFAAVITRFGEQQHEDASNLIINCWRLAKFNDTLQELSSSILKATAKEVSRDYAINEFVKYLWILCEHSPHNVTLAEKVTSILSEFDLKKAYNINEEVGQGDLSSCVKYLYESSLKIQANQFCSDMLEHGKRDFLIPIYKKYNS